MVSFSSHCWYKEKMSKGISLACLLDLSVHLELVNCITTTKLGFDDNIEQI